LDLTALYAAHSDDAVSLAVTVAGDVESPRGSVLFYLDTTHDAQGADVDVSRRPITVADPFKPEFRLDLSFREPWGTASDGVTLHAWIGGEWEK
jgi:hypothetical protein